MTTTTATELRGTPEWQASYMRRLEGISRRAQIGLELELDVDLSAVETAGSQLDLFGGAM